MKTTISASNLTTSTASGATTVSFTSNVKDGSHTIDISVSDYDRNNAAASRTFNTATTVLTLIVSSSADSIWSKDTGITISGTTDSTAKVVVIELDGTQVGTPTVSSDSKFTSNISSITEEDHIITVASTDLSGLSSMLTRIVHIYRTTPKISNIKLTPSPSNTSVFIKITVQIIG